MSPPPVIWQTDLTLLLLLAAWKALLYYNVGCINKSEKDFVLSKSDFWNKSIE